MTMIMMSVVMVVDVRMSVAMLGVTVPDVGVTVAYVMAVGAAVVQTVPDMGDVPGRMGDAPDEHGEGKVRSTEREAGPEEVIKRVQRVPPERLYNALSPWARC